MGCAVASPRAVHRGDTSAARLSPSRATEPLASLKNTPAASHTVRELLASGLASRHASEIVQSLTDDVGPRLAGSPGDQAAVAWALARLRAEGLSNVHAEEVIVPHWERGVETGEIVSPTRQKLRLTAIGGSIGTLPAGVEADVIEVQTLEALDTLDAIAVAGKIVFYNTPTERTRDGSGYGRAVAVRALGAKRASAKGAVGVVIRSIGTDQERLPHTGAQRGFEKGETSIPAAALSMPDADLLHRTLAAKKAARLRMTLGCRHLPDAVSANVIGEVPGTTRAEELVVLGAHLDSWDLGTGALDDGAGVGIVIEAARLILATGPRPARTLRVVLFANEENGLAGAKQYAKAHAHELDRHVVALEADSGTDRVTSVTYGGAPSQHAEFVAMAANLSPLGIAADSAEADGGADLSPIRALGVPVVSLSQDSSGYFDIHHTANDTFDKIHPDNLAQAATAFAVAAHVVLTMNENFGRVPEEKRERRH